MFSEAPDFKAWFPEVDGFPHPDWKTIGKWIDTHADADHLDAAWQEITRVWLEKMCERLGDSYALAESENFHLLSQLDDKEQAKLLSFLERTRSRILGTLADIPLPARLGKHVVLRFSATDDYYRYTSYFDPEGEYAGSGGRFLTDGYMHIAYPHNDTPGVGHSVLAHELTHNLLQSLPMPTWLSEALAMLFAHDLAGERQPVLTHEQAARHRAYWNAKTIQEFWRGLSFSNPEGQELAYELARILLDFITTDLEPSPSEFREFVLHADGKDAGEAAARNFLNVELSDLASTFLGPGEWAPRLS